MPLLVQLLPDPSLGEPFWGGGLLRSPFFGAGETFLGRSLLGGVVLGGNPSQEADRPSDKKLQRQKYFEATFHFKCNYEINLLLDLRSRLDDYMCQEQSHAPATKDQAPGTSGEEARSWRWFPLGLQWCIRAEVAAIEGATLRLSAWG